MTQRICKIKDLEDNKFLNNNLGLLHATYHDVQKYSSYFPLFQKYNLQIQIIHYFLGEDK